MIVSVGRYDMLILTVSKIEVGNQLTVFVVVADLVLASLVSRSMDSLQKKPLHPPWMARQRYTGFYLCEFSSNMVIDAIN